MSQAAVDTAAVLAPLGAALVLVPGRRALLAAGICVVAVAEALLAYALVPGRDVRHAVDSPARTAAVAVAVAVVAAGGWVLARRAAAVPVLLALVAPFRVPVQLGAQRAFLLVPLYVVLAASLVALGMRLARREPVPAVSRLLSVPATVFIGLSSLSLLWTSDVRSGTIEILFFLLPFAVLAGVLARVPPAAWAARALAVTVVAVACGLGGVGLSQLWTGDLYFARDLEVANAYTTYFRTTSLFHDSSVYGSALVVAVLVLLTAMWLRRIGPALLAALLAYLGSALFFTYSQSSVVALAVAALGLGLVCAGPRARWGLAGGTAALVVAAAVTAGVAARGHSAERVTSGRLELATSTARVFVHHPLVGVGVGSQPAASRDEGGKRKASKNVSHTTPLTVAAELGAVGVAAYLVLLAAAAVLLRDAVRRNRPLGLAAGAIFLALVVQSLVYAGFFENPLTWGVLGLAAVAGSSPPQQPAALALAPAVATDGGEVARSRRARWHT